MATKLSNAARDAAAAVVTTMLDGGSLRVIDGEGTVLAELAFGVDAFDPPTAGVAKARPMDAVLAAAGGYPVRFRATARDGKPIFEGSAGPGKDLDLPASWSKGSLITVKEFTYTQPESES